MTIGYLTRTRTVKLDANGNGTITLAPDTGEFWAPNFVRVATVSRAKQVAYCALYQGAINVTDATTFIDETYLGNGDVSSIAAGTIVQRGEAITAQWMDAAPGDVGIMTLYGRNADSLPELATVLSTIPGARFQASNAAVLANIDTLFFQATVNAAANGSASTPVFTTYGALGLDIQVFNNGPASAQIAVQWLFPDAGGDAITTSFRFILPSGFQSESVDFIVPMQSSRALITLDAPTANAASVDLSVNSARYYSGNPQPLPDTNILFSRTAVAIGASATDTFAVNRTWLGRAVWHVHSSVATWSAKLQVLDLNGNVQDISFRSNTTNPQDIAIYVPAMPLRMTFTNGTAGAGTFDSYLVGHPVSGDFS